MELFASTLNEITASVRCVSSIIAVLNAKLTRLIVAHANKKRRWETKKPDKSADFLLVETHKGLTVHVETSLLYTFQRPIQANRNINLR